MASQLAPIALALVTALATASALAQDAPAPTPATPPPAQAPSASGVTWFAMTYQAGERGLPLITYNWSQGPSFRSEMVISGRRIVTLVSGEWYYTIDSLSGSGVAIHRAPQAIRADATRGRPFGREVERLEELGGELIRSDRIAGLDCDIYRITNQRGRSEICATRGAARLPIRIVNFVRASGASEEINYLNWLSGFPVRAGFFEPDPRIEIERVEYEDYRKRSRRELVGPAPPLFSNLLHGAPE